MRCLWALALAVAEHSFAQHNITRDASNGQGQGRGLRADISESEIWQSQTSIASALVLLGGREQAQVLAQVKVTKSGRKRQDALAPSSML
jgi:hypothetical protein